MQFCGKCDAKLESICPQCQSSNLSEFNFCGKCGHEPREPQDAIPGDYLGPQTCTPNHLADKNLTTHSSIEGERKLVTVLFADVANFTSISEKFDPEEIHRISDGCFKILMEEIHQFEGTINQFTGDVHTRIAASMAKGLTQFVGRNKSIHSLNDAYNKARNGSGRVVGAVGDAGYQNLEPRQKGSEPLRLSVICSFTKVRNTPLSSSLTICTGLTGHWMNFWTI